MTTAQNATAPAATARFASDPETGVSPIEALIDDARNGRMVIMVDDEDRENEGDLIIPARFADATAINFMARHGRGLVCLALTRERVEELGLPLMGSGHAARIRTAFTVSIEARDGITTGISAADRATTVAVATDPQRGRNDIVTPGHVFPLMARDGGVIVRAGHTEAAVDIARLAGLYPAGVICEIMNDDGSMARLPELRRFGARHGLRVGTIADLIAYRRRAEKLVTTVLEREVDTRHGGRFRLVVYRNLVDGVEHVALVKGRVDSDTPTLVRMHAVNLMDDIIGDLAYTHGGEVHKAMRRIDAAGRGVVVLMREAHNSSPSESLRQRDGRRETSASNLRDYGTGAQILSDLGIRDMVLLTNSDRAIVGLEGYGLRVIDREPL